MVANDAFEYNRSAIFRRFQAGENFLGGNALAYNFVNVLDNTRVLTAAYWRQKRYFVTGADASIPGRVLVIDRGCDRIAKLGEPGKIRRVICKHVFQARAFGSH